MKVYCEFSLELLPEAICLQEAILMSTHNIPFSIYKKENHPKFSKGPKNNFETAVVNEPSVFEPLKVYCTLIIVY